MESREFGGRRVATLIYYLSDVEKGGETFFAFAVNGSANSSNPRSQDNLSEDAAVKEANLLWDGRGKQPLCSPEQTVPIKVRPKTGAAVLFYNVDPAGKYDPLSVHGYGARFSAEIYARGCHWFPRMFA
jgi:hypothetical protein